MRQGLRGIIIRSLIIGGFPLCIALLYANYLRVDLILDYGDANFDQNIVVKNFKDEFNNKFDNEKVNLISRLSSLASPEFLFFKVDISNKVTLTFNRKNDKESYDSKFDCWIKEEQSVTVKYSKKERFRDYIRYKDLKDLMLNIQCLYSPDPPQLSEGIETVHIQGSFSTIAKPNLLSFGIIWLAIVVIIQGTLSLLRDGKLLITKGFKKFFKN